MSHYNCKIQFSRSSKNPYQDSYPTEDKNNFGVKILFFVVVKLLVLWCLHRPPSGRVGACQDHHGRVESGSGTFRSPPRGFPGEWPWQEGGLQASAERSFAILVHLYLHQTPTVSVMCVLRWCPPGGAQANLEFDVIIFERKGPGQGSIPCTFSPSSQSQYFTTELPGPQTRQHKSYT